MQAQAATDRNSSKKPNRKKKSGKVSSKWWMTRTYKGRKKKSQKSTECVQ